MTPQEQTRVKMLNEVNEGVLTAREAAGLLGVSLRQVRRLLAAYRREGVAAIAHGNRGRRPSHTIDVPTREQVRALAHGRYAGCNQHHLTDLLAQREGIRLSRSTVRRILQKEGITSPRTHRVAAHRSRRERYPKEGMLVQMDGSPHAWLGDRGPRLCLISSIDYATGTVPAALFRQQEDSHGYLLLLRQLATTHGRPVAVYHDRHSIFIPPCQQTLTVEEQLVATNATTQVHRALTALDIRSISAHSPQAKGRIERLFATLQDRLVAELRLAGITTCEGANTFLATFLPRYNTQFGIPARELGRAYRPLETGCDLEQICCFVYYCTVAADNTVRLGEHRIQIQPGPGRMSYAKTRVEVQERLDGALAVYYQGQCLATKAAPEEAPVLRARTTGRPAPDQSAIPRPVDAAVEGVGMLAAPGDRSSTMNDPSRQHIHAPHIPGPDHPFRRSYKTIRRTKSLDE
ncbi:MAG TPA: ISNCY family transposase [Chloroflexota bacterium]